VLILLAARSSSFFSIFRNHVIFVILPRVQLFCSRGASPSETPGGPLSSVLAMPPRTCCGARSFSYLPLRFGRSRPVSFFSPLVFSLRRHSNLRRPSLSIHFSSFVRLFLGRRYHNPSASILNPMHRLTPILDLALLVIDQPSRPVAALCGVCWAPSILTPPALS